MALEGRSLMLLVLLFALLAISSHALQQGRFSEARRGIKPRMAEVQIDHPRERDRYIVQATLPSLQAAQDQDKLLKLLSPRSGVPSSYLGIQPAQYGIPAFGIRRHLVLGSSPLPTAGEFYEVNAVRFRRPEQTANIAELIKEPMSPLYERRHAPPSPLPGGVPRAFYQWPGNITRAEFDAVPYSQRGPLCGHCTNFVSYKIWKGQLFRGSEADAYQDMKLHRQRAEDMLLVVLYLWDLPDMDFKLHYGDGCPTDLPAFSWNICRNKPRAGFTMPSTATWSSALGPVQTQVYHACLAAQYPVGKRRPVAFWRGSNTDPNIVDVFTADNYRKSARIRLHMDFQPTNKTRMDAQLSALSGSDGVVTAAVGPLGDRVIMQDFNKAAVIIDMDGNGWSDRWAKIVHYPTFMLKQASNHTAFFEHLMGPGPIAYFKNDLSDLQEVVTRTLNAWDSYPERLQARAAKMQAFAAALMHQVAVAEAFGHSLMVYHSKVTWKTEMEPGYKAVPFKVACKVVFTGLPEQLCKNVQNHMSEEQKDVQVLFPYV